MSDETSREFLQEGVAAQLYKISNPHGPLWHVLDERLRCRWRNKADDHIKQGDAPERPRLRAWYKDGMWG